LNIFCFEYQQFKPFFEENSKVFFTAQFGCVVEQNLCRVNMRREYLSTYKDRRH
jgi:hypothetical protein